MTLSHAWKAKEQKSFSDEPLEGAKREFDAEYFHNNNNNDDDNDDDDFLASFDSYSSSWQPHPSP